MTRSLVLCAALLITAVRPLAGQSLADVRKLYDAGQYQQAAAAGRIDQDPRLAFLVGQSYQRLSRSDDARKAYDQLAARPDSDGWHFVGRSALALLGSDANAGAEAAGQAIAHGGSIAEAYYQQGLALSMKQDMAGASAAFQKAVDLDPAWAYAHYYAGLSYAKVKRADLTASHFQTFLKLAPDAPEKPEVQSILKTLGAR
jgi:tetratricopeptide (TPR) repeat protein